MMKKCEMYQEGEAFHVLRCLGSNLSICPIKQGTCPYGNENGRFHESDTDKWYVVCKTNCKIEEEKYGLFEKKQGKLVPIIKKEQEEFIK